MSFITDVLLKNVHIWLGSYIAQKFRVKRKLAYPISIVFCLVDHFEPKWGGCGDGEALRRVEEWCKKYPAISDKFRGCDGVGPKHTFFYPVEQYNEVFLNKLSELCKSGYGDVEIHLHHNNDNDENLRKTLVDFKEVLYKKHGLLRIHPVTKQITYGFIHGNWALDNSRRDGNWCGVNNELDVLIKTGCYADFTLPSAPSNTQTKKINSIYYAKDDPSKPKSHNYGRDISVGGVQKNSELMIIQGPLALNWKNRKLGVLPKIESGEVSGDNPVCSNRVELWVDQKIGVEDDDGKIFVKVHTHGAVPENIKYLLGGGLEQLYSELFSKYNDGVKYKLYCVTAWEMYKTTKTIESNKRN